MSYKRTPPIGEVGMAGDPFELVDRFWCSEGCGFVDEHHRCEQWCTLRVIPAAAVNAIKSEG